MDFWLPVVFAGLMALAMLIYVVLDGYDLGVGMLLPGADDREKDLMIASIGPFWDANETWLVLGVGILLIAFPMAHGVILTALYAPVTAMLIGLILRGVAFDFRVKAREPHRPLWNTSFFAGSMLAGFSQGFMLGHYVEGFSTGVPAYLFATLIGICLQAGYCLLGADLAHHEDRGRAAEEGDSLGAPRAVGHRGRYCRRIHRDPVDKRPSVRQVVHVSPVHTSLANSRGYVSDLRSQPLPAEAPRERPLR